MIAYLNGKFLKEEELRLSPNDRGFLFADGVYEFMSYYYYDFFLYDEHINRLKRSLNEISINVPDIENIKDICYDLINLNNYNNTKVHIYIQITRGASFPRKHSFPPENSQKTVYITPLPFISRKEEKEKGVSAITLDDLRWGRCDIKTIALLPNVLAMQKATEVNASEALFVKDGNIIEGTHSNFFGIKNGKVITAPLSNSILAGTIRDFLLKILPKKGIECKEEYIPFDLINDFDELFITSTTYEITPIVKLNDSLIGNGKPGKLTKELQNIFVNAHK